jgi:hypothetical protein
MKGRPLFLCLLLLLLVLPAGIAKASVSLSDYGLVLSPESVRKSVSTRVDSLYSPRWQASETKIIRSLAMPHYTVDHTVAFYLLLVLAAILGGIKTLYPKYFNDLWRAFLNPTLGNRQLRDMILAASYPNLLMNLFACIVLGVWLFYFTSVFVDWRFSGLSHTMIVLLLVCGACVTYFVKYAFVGFVGWVFHMRHTTDLYNFNIFLVNKVLGVFLLPFVVCFAFMSSRWAPSLSLLSAVVAIVFLANRYFRSWGIFSQFFMNSRFHFFMYLCAFELLPMAVLLKLVLRVT